MNASGASAESGTRLWTAGAMRAKDFLEKALHANAGRQGGEERGAGKTAETDNDKTADTHSDKAAETDNDKAAETDNDKTAEADNDRTGQGQGKGKEKASVKKNRGVMGQVVEVDVGQGVRVPLLRAVQVCLESGIVGA
ncbi:hypothetical protein CLOM_g2625, partial [Closterium sp. NIES-68]